MLNKFINIVKGEATEHPPVKMPDSALEFKEPVRQDQLHACEAYTNLKIRFRDIGRMNAIIETLGRDFLTAMPEGAVQSRLGQMAFLYRRMHEDLTADDVQAWLDEAREHEYAKPHDWDEWDEANLREMANQYLMFAHVDPALMERKARLSFEGRKRHTTLKETGDWEQAKGFLAEQIGLHRQIAEARCAVTEESSHYQMLMQEFMPGMTVFEVERLFYAHEEALKELLPEIQEKQAKEQTPLPLEAEYESEAQMWLNRSLLEVLGFDFERGGLYETGHNPVEGGTVDDTRLVISTIDESNFMDSMKSALHEGGHGLYIQGLPRAQWRYQPVGMDLGAAMHESQALLIEMIIGRMPEFFEFLSPRLEGVFHGMNAPALSPENLFALKTRVNPGVDRKTADEVTYFHHVVLRYRLERDLIEGDLKIDDLPEAWVEGIHQALGVLPENHLDGCLQDVHWFVGKFGYFPSYAVGHMIAAQLYSTLRKDIPDLKKQIAAGEFDEIKAWLMENVYSKGRLHPMTDLLKETTGKELKARYLEKHLRKRYLD